MYIPEKIVKIPKNLRRITSLMDINLIPDIYTPSVNNQGHYIDSIPVITKQKYDNRLSNRTISKKTCYFHSNL